MDKPYYLAYEERYQAALPPGSTTGGMIPAIPLWREALDGWVKANRLSDRRVIEFACGEGAAGILLSGSAAGTWGGHRPVGRRKNETAFGRFPGRAGPPAGHGGAGRRRRVRRRARLQRPACS